MIKKIFFIISIFILYSNCSFDTKSGIWTNSEKIEKKTEVKETILFKKKNYDIKEFNKDLLIEIPLDVSKNNNNINIKCGNEIYISADRQLLIEALTNLIENATKYGDANAEILIMAQKRDKVYIHVENKGKMIKAKHWNQIFYRFYRIDKSRSRKGGGTGLGLAIVKHIILVHNGEVFVSSSTKEKTRFTIALPLVDTI